MLHFFRMGVLNRDLMGYNYNGEYLFKMINSSGMNIKLSSGVIKPGWKIKALNGRFHFKKNIELNGDFSRSLTTAGCQIFHGNVTDI